MIGQQFGMEDLDQIGQHHFWVDNAHFPVLVATVGTQARIVVPEVAGLESGEIGIARVTGQQLLDSGNPPGINPKFRVARCIIDLLE